MRIAHAVQSGVRGLGIGEGELSPRRLYTMVMSPSVILHVMVVLVLSIEGLGAYMTPLRGRGLRARMFLQGGTEAAHHGHEWTSQLSSSPEFPDAIREVVQGALAGRDASAFNLAVFFVNSVYDYQSVDYTTIFTAIKEAAPGVTHVVGCTTGGVIGPLDSSRPMDPSEVEARASLSLTLGSMGKDVLVKSVRLSAEDIAAYMADETRTVLASRATRDSGGGGEGERGVTMLFSSEGAKTDLAQLVGKMASREGHRIFGGVASGVTTLHMPKIFVTSFEGGGDGGSGPGSGARLLKFDSGVVGLSFAGNVGLQTVVTRSCLPVGPVYNVAACRGQEILSLMPVLTSPTPTAMELAESTAAAPTGVEEGTQPLVQLGNVIAALESTDKDSADALKRELLGGLATGMHVPRFCL